MDDESRYYLFLPLRHLNNRLTSLLPVTLNQSMQIHLERKVVAGNRGPCDPQRRSTDIRAELRYHSYRRDGLY